VIIYRKEAIMLQLQVGTEANLGESGYRYERHRPGQTLLYQLVEEYYPAFVVQLAAQGTELPEYVRREFERRNTLIQRFGSALTKSPGREALL